MRQAPTANHEYPNASLIGIHLRFAKIIAPMTDAPGVARPVFAANANIIRHGIGLNPIETDKLQTIGASTTIMIIL